MQPKFVTSTHWEKRGKSSLVLFNHSLHDTIQSWTRGRSPNLAKINSDGGARRQKISGRGPGIGKNVQNAE